MISRFSWIILSTILLLQGCAGAVIVSTAAIAAKATTDPRTAGTQIDDSTLELRANYQLSNNEEMQNNNTRFSIVAYQGHVLLIGQAPSRAWIDKAQNLAASLDKTRNIYNEVRLAEPISINLIAHDTWLTTKVRTKLVTHSGIPSRNIRVVSENSEVFLLGIVTREQGSLASTIASQTNGVKRVVMAFTYLD